MLETVFGGLLGGALRLTPEILKHFDRKNERKHELFLQDKQLEFEKINQILFLRYPFRTFLKIFHPTHQY